jgi:elongation factor G
MRNVAFVGHGSSGKTSLTAALLFDAGAVTRLTKVDKGNTITDFEPEEIERKISISSAVCFLEWKDHKVNLVDTPGYSNFLWDTKASLRAVDAAAVVVDAVAGVEVGTEKVWEMLEEYHLPRVFVINKLDRENANFKRILDVVRESFGRQAVPVQLPIGEEKDFTGVYDLTQGKAYIFDKDESGKFKEGDAPAAMKAEIDKAREAMMEMVAEADEKLIEKFFEKGVLTPEELSAGLKKSVAAGQIFPVFVCSALQNIGLQIGRAHV